MYIDLSKAVEIIDLSDIKMYRPFKSRRNNRFESYKNVYRPFKSRRNNRFE